MANTNSQLRIKLTQLKIDQTNLKIEAESLCRSITEILVPELTDIEEMEVAKADVYMDDLVVKQAELLNVHLEIMKVERALG